MIGQTISHYRILSQIGEGGMGVVYVAEDTRLGRRVAVKIPHAEKSERHYRARFLREARAVSALSHRNIAPVYDYGETEEGQPFIVMELVTGQTLGDILSGTGLSLKRAVEIIVDVAEALAEAHRRGIVHRDIKPSNVIINDRGEVRVLDFGLAKQMEGELASASGTDAPSLLSTRTRSDVVIGTPLYLSPEQARGSQVDGRSDLFALGALLYECVAGRPAFSGANVIEIGAQVLHVNPPPPSQFNPRVPAALDRVTLKALAKRPEDRYQTADEFAADLTREFAADLARVRTKFSEADTVRTPRLATEANLLRSSALMTISEGLRRPRFSPLALAALLATALLAVWAYAYLRAPGVHEPEAAAVALYERGVDAMREGAYYKASGLLTQAVEADERFALAHARLAEAWAELDYLDRAKDELILATTLVPERRALPEQDSLYLDAVTSTVRREYPAAVKAYQGLAALNPRQPQAHVDLGRAYEKNNESEKAIISYNEATSLDPNYAAAFLRLGVLHARQKNLPAAASAFERAEKLYAAADSAEGRAEVHFQRGRLFIELGKNAEARRELEQSLELARRTSNLYQQAQALLQLSNAENDFGRAQEFARGAVELAQASGMYNVTALGHIALGTLSFGQGDYPEAERQLARALEFARNHKVRRPEALALFHLGSLRSKQNRPDEALRFVEQAREFFLQGGYRKESYSAAMLVSRLKRQKGDYEGALQTISEQLRLAEQSGDVQQLGIMHREYGAFLSMQDRYPQALDHYRESISISRSLDDQPLLTYSLLNLSNSLWRLGRYDEARQALAQLAEAAGPSGGANKELLARVLLTEARMALSQRRWAEASAKGRQALSLAQPLGGQPKDLVVEADSVVGLAEVFAGSRDKGRSLCEDAARLAAEVGDPWMVSNTQLALAEALLEAGEARGAREAALRAQELFARLGRVESEWHALVVAGMASRRAGDEAAEREYLTRAAALLPRLEEGWGAGAAATYLSRPDVQRLRKELGDASLAALR